MHIIGMLTNKLSRVLGILNRLKYIYPQHILFTIYNSLFMSHINYGILLWGSCLNKIANHQNKAIRRLTNSRYHEHTEPLLKAYELLKAQDIYYLKQLKFYYNLSYSLLLPYFHTYFIFLNNNTDIHPTYHLRPTVRPLFKYPKVDHVFAKSSALYQLVSLLNTVHSTSSDILEKYSYECRLLVCYTCGRT